MLPCYGQRAEFSLKSRETPSVLATTGDKQAKKKKKRGQSTALSNDSIYFFVM